MIKENMDKDVTWSQIARWTPIIAGIIAIVLSYATLITQIAVLENKITNLTNLVENYQKHQETLVSNLVSNTNDLNKRMVVIETQHGMNKQ